MNNKDYLKPLDKKCVSCGKEFISIWVLQKYCSKNCYKFNTKKIAADWRSRVGSLHYNKKRTQNERDLRISAIKILGGCCSRCGFDDYRALQLDHVQGDGVGERSNRKKINRAIVRGWIETSGKYQILCANCNWIKRFENNEGTHRDDLNQFLLNVNSKDGNKNENPLS